MDINVISCLDQDFVRVKWARLLKVKTPKQAWASSENWLGVLDQGRFVLIENILGFGPLLDLWLSYLKGLPTRLGVMCAHSRR